MLTDEETDAACSKWNAASEKDRAAIEENATRLRAMAQAAPPFHSTYLELWRVDSQRMAQVLADGWYEAWVGADAAIEAATLEMIFSSPKVRAWESAYKIVQAALCDPDISAVPELSDLFRNLLEGIADTADYGAAPYIVEGYLIDAQMEKRVVSKAARLHGRKPHVRHAQAAQQLPELWEHMKAQGKSKSEAAPLIAEKLSLASKTVRKKLQGL